MLKQADVTFAAVILVLVGCAGCSHDDVVAPTRTVANVPPVSTSTVNGPADPALWHGTWTLTSAMPADDCLAGWLQVPQTWNNMTIAFDRSGQSARMDFWAGYEKDGGYTPDVFVGTVNEAGQIAASPPSTAEVYYAFVQPSRCYNAGWTIQSGELSGALSPDGHTVSGTIVETFHPVGQEQTFTIRSEFVAVSPQ